MYNKIISDRRLANEKLDLLLGKASYSLDVQAMIFVLCRWIHSVIDWFGCIPVTRPMSGFEQPPIKTWPASRL